MIVPSWAGRVFWLLFTLGLGFLLYFVVQGLAGGAQVSIFWKIMLFVIVAMAIGFFVGRFGYLIGGAQLPGWLFWLLITIGFSIFIFGVLGGK